MNFERKKKITKYVVSTAMVANTLAAPIAVFAADNGSQQTSEAQSAIQKLVDAGILQGDQKGDLQPLEKMTRAQVVSLLAKALNIPVKTGQSTGFSDVGKDSWVAPYLSGLNSLGIIVGDNGKFRPNDLLTREELAALLVRITQNSIVGKGNNLGISDPQTVSDWAKGYVQVALELKLISAPNGVFAGQNSVTRELVAIVANKFIENPEFKGYQQNVQKLASEGKKISNSDPIA
ncbi:S-layer homology domain-containing protein [Paenibacillus sp. MMS18-CY102]|uniref:S-layer homology domain-containing protein n=1 Tax=Paenibacillus sp. MMS18-CY102 TaxID=2682849 RepID=UPI001366376D|nr:S-layer homology domain-containing protein [Paenibacillus sp. MMS18-CY102]MWC28294.1 hypothetical protein [Paenibacillus sp. MMS18-CY102]